jgi:hypothetical protein
VLYFLLAISVAYALGLLLYFAIAWRTWAGAAVWYVATTAVPACVLLIPAEHVVARAFALLVLVDLLLKLVDLGRVRWQQPREAIRWSDYVLFLIPFPVLLVVYDRKRRARRGVAAESRDVVRLVSGGAIFTLCLTLVLISNRSALLRWSFPLDHAVKLCLYLVGIESMAQALWGLERLLGYDTTPIIDRAFLARTPAEFWRRYNQRVHDWLQHNVFVPSGVHAPVLGISAAFLVSAALHEVAFGIATSRFDGYQAAFFLLQAPAVILSGHLLRLGSLLSRAATIAWMAATSTLFFHGIDRVFPFYYASQPWLP